MRSRVARILVVPLVISLAMVTGQSIAQESAVVTASKPLDPLTSVPYDRVTLIDGLVLNIELVGPRPLPIYDAKKEAERRAARKEIPKGGETSACCRREEQDPGGRGGGSVRENRNILVIHLLEGDLRDFSMKRSSLKSIEYYEDMLLAEGEKYVIARDYGRAWECYLKIAARDPNWKGLDEHVNNILFAEGGAALLEGDSERGLRLLRELTDRQPQYPGVNDKLAASYAGRAQRAFEMGFFALGRKILHDAEAVTPGSLSVKAIRERFVSRARSLAESAQTKQGDARLDDLSEALKIWPATAGADLAYNSAFPASSTLDIAVLDIPRNIGPWVRTPADDRITRLLYRPVLVNDSDDALQGKAEGQLAVSVSTADLGRRVSVQLRGGVVWSDGSRVVSPIDVARALTDMAEPSSPRYNARWSDLLDRVETPDESHVEIRLTRAYLKPGSWLLGPVGPAHSANDGRVSTLGGDRILVGDGPYLWGSSKRDRVEFVAAEPQKKGAPEPKAKIHRIREIRYPNEKAAVGAFLRGEVAMIEHVPSHRLPEFASYSDIKVGRDSRPSMHWISLDGRNPILHNRALRRGLSYAIDRKTLLEDYILKRSADAANTPSDGAFPKGSYADATEVKPYEYDALLARMLVTAAKKELGGKPIKLTLEYPAIPEAQAVVPKLVEAMQATGLQIVATERPQSDLEGELHAGRRFDMVYRATPCEDPVTEAGNLLSPCHDAPPATDPLASLTSPRILQLLLLLERAPDYATAKTLLLLIDQECRDELPILPLWQLEDHYAWRTRLTGPPDVTNRLYKDIASWEIQPWFAKDPW